MMVERARWMLLTHSFCIGGALWLAACGAPDRSGGCLDLQHPTPVAGPVLAEVGGTDITAGMLSTLQQDEKSAPVDPKSLVASLEDRVRFELLAQAAWRENYGNHPEVLDAARKVMVRRYLQAKVPVGADAKTVDSNVLLRAYLTNRHLYQKPEVRRLDFVSFPAGEASMSVARSVIARLGEGLEPQEALRVAVRAGRSRPKGKSQAAFVGPEPKWVASPFRTQAELTARIGHRAASQIFALSPAQWVDEPVVTPRGLWVVRVAARRADLARSFEEVKPELMTQLTRERRTRAFAALIDTLRARIPVAVYPQRAHQALDHGAPVRPNSGLDAHAAEVTESGELLPGAPASAASEGS